MTYCFNGTIPLVVVSNPKYYIIISCLSLTSVPVTKWIWIFIWFKSVGLCFFSILWRDLLFCCIYFLFSVSTCFFFLFISVSPCNAACHPFGTSSLFDIGELGCHFALRPGREGWENVCESHTVWEWVESHSSAFNSLQLLTIKVQVTGGGGRGGLLAVNWEQILDVLATGEQIICEVRL